MANRPGREITLPSDVPQLNSKIPRYGIFARFKDRFRGWRDGTRHRPGANSVDDVRPAGHWTSLRQLPEDHYADIDKEAARIAGDLIARMRQLGPDIDLLQVEVAELQQVLADLRRASADRRRIFKIETRLRGRREELLDALRAYEAYRARADALERSARAAKQKVYAYANKRFSVYIGILTNYHRERGLIQSAISKHRSALGPLPPTESIFAAFAAPRDQDPPRVSSDEGK